jgi:hypothetical protein
MSIRRLYLPIGFLHLNYYSYVDTKQYMKDNNLNGLTLNNIYKGSKQQLLRNTTDALLWPCSDLAYIILKSIEYFK